MKILIIDDDSHLRGLIKHIIKPKINAEILEAENGLEALTLLEREKIDLIILDNDMPLMNGHEFLIIVRSYANHKILPVIVLTASNESQTIKNYLDLDVADYILKPFQPNELLDKINKNINTRKKILMIDDNEALKLFIRKILFTRFNNIDFISAANGNEGLDKVVEFKPDLILLDINMPEMTGIEFIKKYRSEYNDINTPIMMITSINDKETIQMMAKYNIIDYILKPVSITDFSKKISNFFRK